MSDLPTGGSTPARSRGAVRRWLTSRRHTAGTAGALAGPLLGIVGVLDASWPAVSVGAYAILALVVPERREPPDPGPPPLVPALRTEAAGLRAATRRDHRLPDRVPAAVLRILDVLDPVLDRLEQPPIRPADRTQLPARLADVAAIVRDDLPGCLTVYRNRPPGTSLERAAAELAEQLAVIGHAVDRLAADVPDVGAQRAAELTEDLRRRYPPSG